MLCLQQKTIALEIWQKNYDVTLFNQSLSVQERIKESSAAEGSNLDANEQILLLSDKVEEMPDLYGWSKKNVETFAKWLDIEVEFEGTGETVKKQSVRTNTALKNIQKIKITLGD